jgi:MFS family permease
MDYGLRRHLPQVLHQLLQVALVGMTLGAMRTVVPALAEAEFGVPRGSFVLLTAFVLAFGVVKGAMNFLAGRLAETHGRRRVLLCGWALALPIAPIVYFAPAWSWVVAATVLLGVQQGLCWSMTQTAKLDLTRPDQRGWVIGLNEFAGYAGMAVAGVLAALAAQRLGTRPGVLVFGLVVAVAGLAHAALAARETLPWARHAAQASFLVGGASAPMPFPAEASGPKPLPQVALSTRAVFATMSWRDRRLAALCQAGLVEKFVDALVWVFWPVFLVRAGLGLAAASTVVGAYGLTWGVAQLATGKLSDRIGRQPLNVGGMVACGAGVLAFAQVHGQAAWSACAALTGLGMAMLYPNLAAAVVDLAAPAWRASAIGIYRFWRDLGYAVGALALGVVASIGGRLEAGFWFVGVAMLASAAWLAWFGEETAPRRLGARRPTAS